MRLLVIGASSYLGAAILKRAPANWQIAATYFSHPFSFPNVAALRADARDADAANRLVAQIRPDAIIHTPAAMNGELLTALNVDGACNIARAAAQAKARLIHISTDVIFDGEHSPYDERAQPNPITPYGESKARSERAVTATHPGPVIVRTSLIYGFDPIDTRTRLTLDGGMPHLFSDEFRCPVFVVDLADALIEIAQNDFVGVLNVAGPQRLSRYDFGLKLARTFDIAPNFQPALSASSAALRPRDCTLGIALAQKLLHTRLRSVDEVLATQRAKTPSFQSPID